MAFDFKNDDEVKQYLENIAVEYRFGCYTEKNPEACHLLGMYFAVIKKDLDKALKVYKVNCDNYNWGPSCYKYAYWMNSKPENKNIANQHVIDYFKKGCEISEPPNPKSCYYTGVKLGKQAELQTEKEGKTEKYLKAMEYMDKACNLRVGQACFNLSSIYFTGIPEANIAKSMQKVYEYALKGCENNEINSCINLSVIFTKGEGGFEKNLELAKKYKDIATELYKQMSGTSGGVSFEQGID